MTETAPLAPGSTIGILGGGQLGRMLALAAARLGMRTHIYCPDPHSPAFEVTPRRTVADYDDADALRAFAAHCDVVTYEFENVPVETARIVAEITRLAPGSKALSIAQDRIAEKRFLEKAGIAVAPWMEVEDANTLKAAIEEIGMPSVLKTARLGYDGKGQRLIRRSEEVMPALTALGRQPLVLESFIRFEREISVVVARNANGQVRDYEPAENVHRNHVLKTSTVPADIDRATALKASRIAGQIVGALDYVGVMGVEFFSLPIAGKSDLLVNEIAPRVHNSGHWTEAVCATDQFEQHIRAILNWPLGAPSRFADVVMENLLGDEVDRFVDSLKPGDRPHIYGKAEARPGRKMGHVNHITLVSDDS